MAKTKREIQRDYEKRTGYAAQRNITRQIIGNAKCKIQLDFSKSSQRAGLPIFLNFHLFLHAETPQPWHTCRAAAPFAFLQ